MPAIVNSVKENSIAEELEIKSGDILVSIDEQKVKDLIDYNFLCKSEFLTLEILKTNGETEIIELEKDYDEELGIIFESAVFDKIKPCTNHCIFCFVDQQPDGLRDTLYIKDDDYRLSYLQGTYVTLTNLSKDDKKRIELLRLGPLYISVHTTNPELRAEMLNNPNASKIMDNLKWLSKLQMPVHLQVVLCPKYNDGEELKRTLDDFKKLKNIASVAIVPVGITKYRKNKLNKVTKKIARETINLVDNFNKEVGKHLACCSDEFFSIAEMPIPSRDYYGNFSQLDDGVGALRLVLDDFEIQCKRLPKKIEKEKKYLFVASKIALPVFENISLMLSEIENLSLSALPPTSTFWGDTITVAGLTTSSDLINTINNANVDKKNLKVIIPTVMLRPFTQEFLDGKTLDYVKEKTGVEFLVVNDYYSVKEIIDDILL